MTPVPDQRSGWGLFIAENSARFYLKEGVDPGILRRLFPVFSGIETKRKEEKETGQI